MSGTEDEVLDEAVRHVQAKHSMKNATREDLKGYLTEAR
jgi:predicted small metal-binding protein